MSTLLRNFRRTAPLVAAGAVGTMVVSYTGATGASAASAASGTEITASQGPFGAQLTVGSGHFAGYSVYLITSDSGMTFGCTPTIIKSLPGGPGACTGPETDQKAEWPAVTTDGAPVAGPGVDAKMLGSVMRKGIGDQVTYDGHPLYLFDQGPGQVTGVGWDEPSLPPWHGVWYLVSPDGHPLAWPGQLATVTIDKRTVLAAVMLTGIGWERFPVYSYSKDASSTSNCTGTCAVNWPPMLTTGVPGVSGAVAASAVSEVKLANGTEQVAYKGRPLYLFADEAIAPQGDSYAATGNGNGANVGGGTFSLVSP